MFDGPGNVFGNTFGTPVAWGQGPKLPPGMNPADLHQGQWRLPPGMQPGNGQTPQRRRGHRQQPAPQQDDWPPPPPQDDWQPQNPGWRRRPWQPAPWTGGAIPWISQNPLAQGLAQLGW